MGGVTSGDLGVQGGESSGECGGVGREVTAVSRAGRFLGDLSPTPCSAITFRFLLSVACFFLLAAAAAWVMMCAWIFRSTTSSLTGADGKGASFVFTYVTAFVHALATIFFLS